MSGMPTYDTHFFYNDFILGAETDSLKNKFIVIFKRDRIQENAFRFTGVDSIEVVFTEPLVFENGLSFLANKTEKGTAVTTEVDGSTNTCILTLKKGVA